ncbi:MAG: type VI secretion system baseplate subunit TssE [Holosporales bacterium]|jgi:type VI secretion system lysozyme-like protein|nr:type VI secretion system baseplate subunit TssE [Holosporales bacterium]
MIPEKRQTRYEKRALFERLAVKEDTQTACLGYHTIETLKQSIMREMTYLLNERTGPFWQTEDTFTTPYAYGLRDILFSCPYDADFWERTSATYLQNLITYYEPRIHNVQVHMDEEVRVGECLTIRISGEIALKNVYYPVSFPIAIYI